jgi:hypothetical protein
MSEKRKRKSIALTEYQYALFEESRVTFSELTGVNISQGAFVCALSLGASASKALAGIGVKCPQCKYEVVMQLYRPKKKKSIARSSVLHNRIPEGVASTRAPLSL